MRKIYLCILMVFCVNLIKAQEKCQNYSSDNMYLRYTASGAQEVVNGNHSKAINESRKIANIVAECELTKMINSLVTRVSEEMSIGGDEQMGLYIDTMLVSSYKIFKGMRTICQSETKLIDNTYVTYITKEISLDNISDVMYFDSDKDRQKFREKLSE